MRLGLVLALFVLLGSLALQELKLSGAWLDHSTGSVIKGRRYSVSSPEYLKDEKLASSFWKAVANIFKRRSVVAVHDGYFLIQRLSFGPVASGLDLELVEIPAKKTYHFTLSAGENLDSRH